MGRLPLGPAGDAAVAAGQPGAAGGAVANGVAVVGGGAAGTGGPEAGGTVRARRSAEVLDLGAASRTAILKRVVPIAAALGVAAAAAIVLGRRR